MSSSQISETDIDRLLARLNDGESDLTRHLTLDGARRAAILSFTDVQACPGSGKTTLVGLKLLLLLENWHDAYSGICVLTHSNVAIDEIMSRVGRDASGSCSCQTFKVSTTIEMLSGLHASINDLVSVIESEDLPLGDD
jgi:ATP-dependent exoDNAse (exonuclease V) beta subunit